MPPQERLRLNNEQGLLPCTRRSSEQDQDHPIRLCASRSFDVSAENNELLTEERVLGHEFGLASGYNPIGNLAGNMGGCKLWENAK